MAILYILGAISVVLALFSGYFNLKGAASYRLISKSLASVMFCFTAFGAILIKNVFTEYAVFIVIALTLGMLGDIFLCMDKLATPKAKKLFDALGVSFFALGHVAYIIIFLSVVGSSFTLYTLAFLPIITVFLSVLILLKKIKCGKLMIPFLVYSLILGLMLVSSINLYLTVGGKGGLLVLIAGILFSVSDSCLTVRDYGIFNLRKPLVYIVLFTYYVAQVLFAISIVFIA